MEDIYRAEIKLSSKELQNHEFIEERGVKPKYFDNLLQKITAQKISGFIKTNILKIQNDIISYKIMDSMLYLVVSNRPVELETTKKIETNKIKFDPKPVKIKPKENLKNTTFETFFSIFDPLKNTILETIYIIFKPLKKVFAIILLLINIKIYYFKIKSFYLQFFRSKLTRENAIKILLNKNFDLNVIEKLLPQKKFVTKIEMEENLSNFLKTTNLSKDLLENITKYNQNMDSPYVISLIGTNGVGKSTTISKLLYYLTVKNKFNVTIIAGDTFRSGAIEQLQGYVNNFIQKASKENGKIRFYSRGYVKDEVGMINYAINSFKREFQVMKNGNLSNISTDQFSYSNFDKNTTNNIIIIDTSGRQPTNESLMNSLLKLHRVCLINQSYIVSEIITGQKNNILKFISILKQVNIDLEVIFTKLDCTHSEIGMAFNILYDSDIPIAFVCYGEKNTDMSVFNGKYILDALELC
ncbi:Signal recognition particle receptor subunit alpha like protein [Cucumispora dikerogammari]|nr:Signal recognition particle receptor subunit alpha like protein [Cucumispora dikerogammari]